MPNKLAATNGSGSRLESPNPPRAPRKNQSPDGTTILREAQLPANNFAWVARISGGRYSEPLMIPAYDRSLRGTQLLGLILIVVVGLTEAIAP
jgi:hypothetical protein